MGGRRGRGEGGRKGRVTSGCEGKEMNTVRLEKQE